MQISFNVLNEKENCILLMQISFNVLNEKERRAI